MINGINCDIFLVLLTKKLIQFGVFTEHLSIAELMFPHFGCGSYKMFIRRKLIRLRYKIWELGSDDGYQFKGVPY